MIRNLGPETELSGIRNLGPENLQNGQFRLDSVQAGMRGTNVQPFPNPAPHVDVHVPPQQKPVVQNHIHVDPELLGWSPQAPKEPGFFGRIFTSSRQPVRIPNLLDSCLVTLITSIVALVAPTAMAYLPMFVHGALFDTAMSDAAVNGVGMFANVFTGILWLLVNGSIWLPRMRGNGYVPGSAD